MPHHLYSLLFATFLCGSLCHCASVGTADDLISLFNNATGNTLETDIEVTADLDFSASNLIIPLGAFSNGTCVSYSGVFHGNGHSIKGLVMDATNNEEYKNAGLFCSLKDATVENLVIDSSCSFTGYYAGSLSVSVNGSLIVTNTTNKAAVSGSDNVGGFIGFVQQIKQATVISFDGCLNDGNVTGNVWYVGGFVGLISSNTNMVLTISNSINNAIVKKYWDVGGFVGYIRDNINTTITISNSTNNGDVIGMKHRAAGFVGYIENNTIITVTISNSVNNGKVTGSWDHVGGFVGMIDTNTNMTMTIFNSTNNGNVNGSNYVGGFVGLISSNSPTYSTALVIISSANKGSISTNKNVACGFVCINPEKSFDVKTTIKNSINKGIVNANTCIWNHKHHHSGKKCCEHG